MNNIHLSATCDKSDKSDRNDKNDKSAFYQIRFNDLF